MKKVSSSPVDTGKPHAWVVNSKDRGRKSIKAGNKIYLEDGQEFEIELHNPMKENVLADIRVNGQSVSQSGLVIRPGQRFYLDCFVDDKKKFIYKTYEVEDTKESKEAIENNGFVEVYFYKEDVPNFKNIFKYRDIYIDRYHYVDRWPYYPYWSNGPYTYPNIVFGSTTTTPLSTYTNTISNCDFNCDTFNVSSSSLSSNVSYTANSFYNSKSMNETMSGGSGIPAQSSIKNIETGRIEKGDKSKQEFVEVDMNFESYVLSQVVYQILPASQKPVETNEIKTQVNFCPNCGRKVSDKENFCSGCGERLK
mgnify:CR=1 FL=1